VREGKRLNINCRRGVLTDWRGERHRGVGGKKKGEKDKSKDSRTGNIKRQIVERAT